MSFQISGPSGNVVEVNLDKEIQVALSKILTGAGYAVMIGESDDGTVTGSASRAPFEVSADYRMRAGIDTLALSEQFLGTAINTTLWSAPTTGMSITVANGLATLNAASSIVAGNVAAITSKRAYPKWGSFTTWLEMNTQFSRLPTAGNVCEWGNFIASGVAAPTDGAFFRYNALGEFYAVLTYNGTEQLSALLDAGALVGVNTTRAFLVGLHNTSVTFWIDDVKVAEFPLPPAGAAMNSAGELPVSFRNYNAATAPTDAQQMKLGEVNLTLGEYHGTKRHDHIMAGMGGICAQGQTGGTLGSTSNITNAVGGALPAAVLPTNATAALGTGLGGFFHELATAVANTDVIISSYQVPVVATNANNKMLYITGVHIESFVDAPLTGGGYNALMQLCFGSTAVSLATTETVTTNAPRRKSLGNQLVPAAATALTVLNTIDRKFDTPIPVFPGQFIQVVKRIIGTAATGTGSIVHAIDFDGYWE